MEKWAFSKLIYIRGAASNSQRHFSSKIGHAFYT